MSIRGRDVPSKRICPASSSDRGSARRSPACAVGRETEETGGKEQPERTLCQHYMKTGTCHFGDNCKYYHLPPSSPATLSGEKKLPVCPVYEATKQCEKLNTCPYYHRDIDCPLFFRTRDCHFGSSCRKRHRNVTPAPPSPASGSAQRLPSASASASAPSHGRGGSESHRSSSESAPPSSRKGASHKSPRASSADRPHPSSSSHIPSPSATREPSASRRSSSSSTRHSPASPAFRAAAPSSSPRPVSGTASAGWWTPSPMPPPSRSRSYSAPAPRLESVLPSADIPPAEKAALWNRELPPEWRAIVSSKGEIFFYNEVTKERTWVPPVDPHRLEARLRARAPPPPVPSSRKRPQPDEWADRPPLEYKQPREDREHALPRPPYWSLPPPPPPPMPPSPYGRPPARRPPEYPPYRYRPDIDGYPPPRMYPDPRDRYHERPRGPVDERYRSPPPPPRGEYRERPHVLPPRVPSRYERRKRSASPGRWRSDHRKPSAAAAEPSGEKPPQVKSEPGQPTPQPTTPAADKPAAEDVFSPASQPPEPPEEAESIYEYEMRLRSMRSALAGIHVSAELAGLELYRAFHEQRKPEAEEEENCLLEPPLLPPPVEPALMPACLLCATDDWKHMTLFLSSYTPCDNCRKKVEEIQRQWIQDQYCSLLRYFPVESELFSAAVELYQARAASLMLAS